jgi:hypothetical protein
MRVRVCHPLREAGPMGEEDKITGRREDDSSFVTLETCSVVHGGYHGRTPLCLFSYSLDDSESRL